MPAGIKATLYEIAYSADCLLNAVTGGYASEPFSARCYRRQDEETWLRYCRIVLDAMLGHEHCQDSYEWLPMKQHYPPELR